MSETARPVVSAAKVSTCLTLCMCHLLDSLPFPIALLTKKSSSSLRMSRAGLAPVLRRSRAQVRSPAKEASATGVLVLDGRLRVTTSTEAARSWIAQASVQDEDARCG